MTIRNQYWQFPTHSQNVLDAFPAGLYDPSHEFEPDYGAEVAAIDEELYYAVERERDESLASLRWALGMIASLLPQARNLDAADWRHPDWLVALARAGMEPR